jgi:hypothetical protein
LADGDSGAFVFDSADGVLVGIVWAGCDASAGMGMTAASDISPLPLSSRVLRMSLDDAGGFQGVGRLTSQIDFFLSFFACVESRLSLSLKFEYISELHNDIQVSGHL